MVCDSTYHENDCAAFDEISFKAVVQNIFCGVNTAKIRMIISVGGRLGASIVVRNAREKRHSL